MLKDQPEVKSTDQKKNMRELTISRYIYTEKITWLKQNSFKRNFGGRHSQT